MSKVIHILLFLSSVFTLGDFYNVLLVFPFPTSSHSLLGEGYVKPLLKNGYSVTYITPKPMKEHENLTQINLSFLMNQASPFNLTNALSSDINFSDYNLLFSMVNSIVEVITLHPSVQNLLHDTSKHFDLVIAEWMFSEVYSGFAAVYDCPYIWSSSLDPHWLVLKLIDELPSSAYNSDILHSATIPFSFFERVSQFWIQLKVSFDRYINIHSKDEELYTKVFKSAVEKRNRKLPSFDEMKYKGAMVIGNSHVSLGQPVRLPQNYKSIGGYHIDDELKPLPENLKTILDNSPNGVIYFSMGSILESKDWPTHLKINLKNMFGQLKQTVIWKFEEHLPDAPKNLHTFKWLPQQSVLAHPNVKLFVTHGGLLSTTEAVHFGVPIIGIPVFADQELNIDRAAKKGFGTKVKLNHDLVENLRRAINDFIGNQNYTETVKKLSFIYHDRLVSPKVELIHWVRHVIETQGAAHLASPALLVPWYQKMYLDLMFIVILAVICTVFSIKKLIRYSNVNLNKKNQ